MGKLIGRYFDEQGVTTVEWARVVFEAEEYSKSGGKVGHQLSANGAPIPDSDRGGV